MSEHKHEHTHEHDHSHNHENFEQTKKASIIKICAGAAFFAGGYAAEEFFSAPNIVCFILFAIAYIAVGFEVVKDAVQDIFEGKVFNECLLMSVASFD